jgi:hypothetical protein
LFTTVYKRLAEGRHRRLAACENAAVVVAAAGSCASTSLRAKFERLRENMEQYESKERDFNK